MRQEVRLRAIQSAVCGTDPARLNDAKKSSYEYRKIGVVYTLQKHEMRRAHLYTHLVSNIKHLAPKQTVTIVMVKVAGFDTSGQPFILCKLKQIYRVKSHVRSLCCHLSVNLSINSAVRFFTPASDQPLCEVQEFSDNISCHAGITSLDAISCRSVLTMQDPRSGRLGHVGSAYSRLTFG